MLSNYSHIGFCGSRSLQLSTKPLVSSVVSIALNSSAQLMVGCSVGADALVLNSIHRSVNKRLTVFSAFGFNGVGSCAVSAVSTVQAAAQSGASVRWWAGGLASVPLRQRLALRSVALVKSLAQNPPSALLCFLASPRSRGSLLACRLAARSGVAVYIFCIGFSPTKLRALGRGSYTLVQLAGHSAVRWHPK